MSIAFIRTTHDENGRFRPFPAEAHHFWVERGEHLGRLLRPESPLTLTELRLAYTEAADEHIATCSNDELLITNVDAALCEPSIVWCLLQLLAYGLVTAVPAPPTPLTGQQYEPKISPPTGCPQRPSNP